MPVPVDMAPCRRTRIMPMIFAGTGVRSLCHTGHGGGWKSRTPLKLGPAEAVAHVHLARPGIRGSVHDESVLEQRLTRVTANQMERPARLLKGWCVQSSPRDLASALPRPIWMLGKRTRPIVA